MLIIEGENGKNIYANQIADREPGNGSLCRRIMPGKKKLWKGPTNGLPDRLESKGYHS